MSVGEKMQQQAEAFCDRYNALRQQIGRVIVGNDDIANSAGVDGVDLRSFLSERE